MGRAALAAKVFIRSRITMLFMLTGLAISTLLFSTAAQTTVMFEKQGAAVLGTYPWDAFLAVEVEPRGLPLFPQALRDAARAAGVARYGFQVVYVLEGPEKRVVAVYVLDDHTYRRAGLEEPCVAAGVFQSPAYSSLIRGCTVLQGDARSLGLGERIREALGRPLEAGLGPSLYLFTDSLAIYPASRAGDAAGLLEALEERGFSPLGADRARLLGDLPMNGTSLLYVLFDRESYFDPTDVEGSVQRLRELVDRLSAGLEDRGYAVRMKQDLGGSISGLGVLQTISRVSVVFSELPSIVIVGIVATSLPSVVAVRLRRLVALVKARGIGEASVSRGFLYTCAAWTAAGSAAGYLLGIGLASALSGYSLPRAWGLVDPLSTAAFLAVSLLVPLLAARRSMSAVAGVPVHLLERDIVGEEELVGRPKAGKLAWVSLGLGTYYVVTRMLGFSPMDYWAEARSRPLLLLVLILLASIDGFVDYLGPVFLAYGTAKITASSRRVLGVLMRAVAGIAGEYRDAAARLAASKPFRVALVIMIASFAIGTSVSGIVSGSATRTALERSIAVGVGAEAAGYKYMDSVASAVEELGAVVREASSQGIPLVAAIYINTSLCGCTMGVVQGDRVYEVDGVLVVLNPGDMPSAMIAPERLGGTGMLRRVTEALERSSYLYIGPAEPGAGSGGGPVGQAALIIRGEKGVVNHTIEIGLASDAVPGGYLVAGLIAGSTGAAGSMPMLGPMQVLRLYSLPRHRLLVAPRTALEHLPPGSGCVAVVYTVERGAGLLEARDYRVVEGWVEARSYVESLDYLWYSFETVTLSGLVLLAMATTISAAVAYASIDENAGSYAALRARGVPRAAIARMINAEILAPSLLSAALGFVMGAAGGLGAVKKMLDMPMMSSVVSAYLGRVPIVIEPASLLLSAAAVVPVAVAALLTGLYALRGPVGEALRRTAG